MTKRKRPQLRAGLEAALGRLALFSAAIGELDGRQRALVLEFGRKRLGRAVGARPIDRDAIPARGNWELYGELGQLEELLEVYRAFRAPGRLALIQFAWELAAAQPPLPPGYFR